MYPVTSRPIGPAGRVVRPPRPARRRHVPTTPIPASGAWREDQPVGNRQFVELGPLPLEAGGQLPEVTLAYETWGELSPAGDNAILVLHALTGDSHVVGEAGAGHASAG